jgi:hypothetical protein
MKTDDTGCTTMFNERWRCCLKKGHEGAHFTRDGTMTLPNKPEEYVDPGYDTLFSLSGGTWSP